MSTIRITMPQLGESVHEGTISKWLVKPGDKVVEFEPIFEVETDKGSTEVPSPVTGVLKEILAADGTTVPSGGEIAVVEVEGAENAPVLMLSNSLGTNLHMWDDQAPEWAKHFRLVRYDRRGPGTSGVPKGPDSMERLGRDVLAIPVAPKYQKNNWYSLAKGGRVDSLH